MFIDLKYKQFAGQSSQNIEVNSLDPQTNTSVL